MKFIMWVLFILFLFEHVTTRFVNSCRNKSPQDRRQSWEYKSTQIKAVLAIRNNPFLHNQGTVQEFLYSFKSERVSLILTDIHFVSCTNILQGEWVAQLSWLLWKSVGAVIVQLFTYDHEPSLFCGCKKWNPCCEMSELIWMVASFGHFPHTYEEIAIVSLYCFHWQPQPLYHSSCL